MKKILLIGGYGFIGSNILNYIDKFLKEDIRVIVFDRFNCHPFGLAFKCIEKTYNGDFADSSILEQIFSENDINYIIHSLSSTVPSSSGNAIFDINANVIPTIQLLELMKKFNILNIAYISSGGAIYGESANDIQHSEDENSFPKSSYGISKITIEKYLFQYHFLYGINPLILRLSNPYGLFHYSSKQGVINIAIDAAVNNKPFSVWGDGNGKKDYIYIEDFCEILFKLIDKKITTTILNVGSNYRLSVNEILLKIKKIKPSFAWDYKNSNILDVNSFNISTQKLNSIIDEYKFTPFEKGLKKIVSWSQEINISKL
ncbi:MAG: NAD-dependent epimerase/dehydratase family protein [Bacteroidota bacterium]